MSAIQKPRFKELSHSECAGAPIQKACGIALISPCCLPSPESWNAAEHHLGSFAFSILSVSYPTAPPLYRWRRWPIGMPCWKWCSSLGSLLSILWVVFLRMVLHGRPSGRNESVGCSKTLQPNVRLGDESSSPSSGSEKRFGISTILPRMA